MRPVRGRARAGATGGPGGHRPRPGPARHATRSRGRDRHACQHRPRTRRDALRATRPAARRGPARGTAAVHRRHRRAGRQSRRPRRHRCPVRHAAGRHHRCGPWAARRRPVLRRRQRVPDPGRPAVHRHPADPLPAADGRPAHHPAGQGRGGRGLVRDDRLPGRGDQAGRPARPARRRHRLRGGPRPGRRSRQHHPDGDRYRVRRPARRRDPAGDALQDDHPRHAAAGPLGPAGDPARRHRGHLRLGLPGVRQLRRRDRVLPDRPLPSGPVGDPGGGPVPDDRGRGGGGGGGPADRRAAPPAAYRTAHLRPAVPVPRPVDGPLPVRRDHRCPRPQHAGECRLCEHHPGGGGGRGLDPGGPLPAGGRRLRRRRHGRPPAALAGRRVPRLRGRRHRRRRRGRRHPVRPAPARDDRGHRRRGDRRGVRRGRPGTRRAADLRGAGHGHREQRLPWHPVGRRPHRPGDAHAAPAGRGSWRTTRGDRRADRLRLARDLHPGPGGQRRGRDQCAAEHLRPAHRPGRHHQYQGFHRPCDGRRDRRRRRDQGPGDGDRATGAELQGARPRTRHPQPVPGRGLPGAVRPAPGRRVRLADRHVLAALDPRARRPAPSSHRARVRLPDRRRAGLAALAGPVERTPRQHPGGVPAQAADRRHGTRTDGEPACCDGCTPRTGTRPRTGDRSGSSPAGRTRAARPCPGRTSDRSPDPGARRHGTGTGTGDDSGVAGRTGAGGHGRAGRRPGGRRGGPVGLGADRVPAGTARPRPRPGGRPRRRHRQAGRGVRRRPRALGHPAPGRPEAA